MAWIGRRDHALRALVIQTGVRVADLTGLLVGDLHLRTAPHPPRGAIRRARRAPSATETPANSELWGPIIRLAAGEWFGLPGFREPRANHAL